MMQFEVTASQLNIRKVIPMSFEDKSSVVGKVFRGFRFQAIEVPIVQIPNPSLGRWYKDKDGFFYWGQAVAPSPIVSTGIPETNYNALIRDIPAEWRMAGGRNIHVAILDTAFIIHRDLKNNIQQTFNAVDNSTDVTPVGNDNVDHGNLVAGMVASNSTMTEGIIGMAPQCKVSLIKISNNGNIEMRNVLNGLRFALDKTEAQIINLSFAIDESEYLPFQQEMVALIESGREKGVLVIASAGDNSGLLSARENLLMPAHEESCISIGTINSAFIKAHPNAIYHSRLNYVIPNQILKSCSGSTNAYSTIRNSSMAAAVLSGTAALALSHHVDATGFDARIERLNAPFNTVSANPDLNFSIYKL
ncbi:MAG: S8/S53 family peptidase [Saprospiraceae bacterium]